MSTHTYRISAIPAFDDNYIWCLHDDKNALVVDPGDAKVVERFLASHDLRLSAILITHHHFDHTGGINELVKGRQGLEVYGPHNPKIKGITKPLKEGDSLTLTSLDTQFSILELPGHTLDHIAFVNDELVFCGDTLFSAGCGRMFEGTPEMFVDSLNKLSALPAHTKVYCTHEYTLANLAFACAIEPDNKDLNSYHEWAKAQRKQDEITLPSSIAEQLKINPFLRTQQPDVVNKLKADYDLKLTDKVSCFAKLRALKDSF